MVPRGTISAIVAIVTIIALVVITMSAVALFPGSHADPAGAAADGYPDESARLPSQRVCPCYRIDLSSTTGGDAPTVGIAF